MKVTRITIDMDSPLIVFWILILVPISVLSGVALYFGFLPSYSIAMILVSSIVSLIATSLVWSRLEEMRSDSMEIRYHVNAVADKQHVELDTRIIGEIAKIRDSIESLRSFQNDLTERQAVSNQEIAFLVQRLEKTFRTLEHSSTLASKKGEAEDARFSTEKMLSIYKEVSSEFAHSIRTPLASIDTAITNVSQRLPSILGKDDAEETDKSLIGLLENASISLNDIRDILRHGAGFIPEKPETIDFPTLLRKVERICREATGSKTEITSTIDLPPFDYYWLNLFIPLVEVLENAMEAVDNEGKIEVTCTQDRSNNIRVDVSNTGKTIPREAREEIFEGFSTKGEGHGIGLRMAKRVLESVDGNIDLVSKPGSRITTFRITIKPLKK